jgi:hypothetical protein
MTQSVFVSGSGFELPPQAVSQTDKLINKMIFGNDFRNRTLLLLMRYPDTSSVTLPK